MEQKEHDYSDELEPMNPNEQRARNAGFAVLLVSGFGLVAAGARTSSITAYITGVALILVGLLIW